MALKPQRALRLLASAAIVSLVAASAHTEPASWDLPDEAAASPVPAPPLAYAAIEAPGPVREADEPDGKVADRVAPDAQPFPDIAAVRTGIELARKGDGPGADAIRATLTDRAARTLLDWVAIRSGNSIGFERIVEVLRENPDWPAGATIRRRAEEALLTGRKPPAVVRAFFATQRPSSAAGKLALALAFKADGLDRDAAALVRDAWREDNFGTDFEDKILEAFPDVLTADDHRFRMERALFKENWGGAQRAARRVGKDHAALVKARMAVARKAGNAAKMLDAVPPALRTDTSYVFSRAQHLRRGGKHAEAAKLLAGLSRDPAVLVDGDEWWEERRVLARELLDDGDPKTAYEVARAHGAEADAQRIEAEFHAGWIALRFLGDARLAASHFADAAAVAETPISVARAAYWQGRAAEGAGDLVAAERHFRRAAEIPITYYGQLSRMKLGEVNLPLRAVAQDSDAARAAFERSTPGRALKLLREAGVRDLAMALATDLAKNLPEAGQLDGLAHAIAETRDARAMLAVGKAAVHRGFPLDSHAYPVLGIPTFDAVGGKVEKAMVYAIARQESAFDHRAQSSAGARGLMQLMPATAKRTAQRFGLDFDLDRLVDDPAYNAKIGSAHLGELMEDWKGSLILAFASYNAGGGNVKKWIDAYGDPRRPDVDPVDWVERIPFSETRNYVQRVMENLQVYRHRLHERSAYVFDLDLRRGRAVQ
jgi:soluble lytic murein transglycosylase